MGHPALVTAEGAGKFEDDAEAGCNRKRHPVLPLGVRVDAEVDGNGWC